MTSFTNMSFAMFSAVCLLSASQAAAQFDRPVQPEAKQGPVIIDSPPPAPPGVVLQPPGQVLVQGVPARVRFQSQTPGVSFQLLTGSAYSSMSGVSYGVGYGFGGWGYGWGWGGVAPYYGEIVTKSYQPICTAPCEATLLTGRHRFALSLDGGAPLNVSQPVEIVGDSIVDARYVSKAKLRKAGWGVFVAGTITGLAMMFASVNYGNDYYRNDQIRVPSVFYTGVGIFTSSIIAGAALAAQRDEASIRVYPGTLSSSLSR